MQERESGNETIKEELSGMLGASTSPLDRGAEPVHSEVLNQSQGFASANPSEARFGYVGAFGTEKL